MRPLYRFLLPEVRFSYKIVASKLERRAGLTQLLAEAREFHKRQFGEAPFVVVSAPGFVNLFGDLTENAEGILVQFAIAQRIVVSLSPRSDNQVRFFSREFNEKKRCTLQTLKFRKEDRWANFPKGAVYYQFEEENSCGLNISIFSEIPINGGYSSSQALSLASVLAVSEMRGFRLENEEAIEIALRIEREFVKNQCHPASFLPLIYSNPYECIVHDLKTRHLSVIELPDLPQIYLIQTNLPASVFDELFNNLQDSLKKSIRFINGLRANQALRDYDKNDIKSFLGQIPEEHRRRALFLVEEITRARDSLNYMRNKDWKSLGKTMVRSHEGLRDLLEISCPEIDWIVKRASDTPGVYGARMITNGAGASVVVLADHHAQPLLKNVLEEYERIFSFHPTLIDTHPSHKVEFH